MQESLLDLISGNVTKEGLTLVEGDSNCCWLTRAMDVVSFVQRACQKYR